MKHKAIKYCVAVVLRSGHRNHEYLAVRRPDDDVDLAGNWGLPAVTLQPDETPEDGARRVCREKLGCSAEPIRFLGAMHQERNSYNIVLMDIEMMLVGTEQPDIAQAQTTATAYIAQKWSKDPKELLPSARHGSCCSSIFLQDQGIVQRDDWVLSLAGSSRVG